MEEYNHQIMEERLKRVNPEEAPRETEALRKEDFLKHIKTTKDFLAMTPKPQPFIVDKMIVEGDINVITAKTGIGKSLFMLKMMNDIVLGQPFLGAYPTKKSRVLILDLEMGENSIITRFHSIVEPEADISVFYGSATDVERDYKVLKEVIKDNFDLVVVDTLSSAHDRQENENTAMANVMACMRKLINEANCTILILHHHGKGNDYKKSDKSRGATGIIDKASSHIEIEPSTKFTGIVSGNNGFQIKVEQGKAREMDILKPFMVSIVNDKITKKTSFIQTAITEEETLTNAYIAQIKTHTEAGNCYTKRDYSKVISEKLGMATPIEPTDSTLGEILKYLIADNILDSKKCGEVKAQFGIIPTYIENGVKKDVSANAKIYWLKDTLKSARISVPAI